MGTHSFPEGQGTVIFTLDMQLNLIGRGGWGGVRGLGVRVLFMFVIIVPAVWPVSSTLPSPPHRGWTPPPPSFQSFPQANYPSLCIAGVR